MKKVSSLINADFKHATQLKIKYKNVNNTIIQIGEKKKNLTRQTTFKDIEKRKLILEQKFLYYLKMAGRAVKFLI